MTIGIDIRVLGSRAKSGIEEYTENLLAHLIPLDKKIKYKLFFSSWKNDLPDYSWTLLPNVEIKKYKLPNRLLFYSSNFFNAPFIDKLLGGVDVFFSPHFFITALSPSCRRVTTFHDLSFIHFPEFFSWRKKVWHNFEMKPSWQSRFSDRIIAVSNSTRNDLVNFYGVDPAKIQVVYSGISPMIKKPMPDKLKEFRKKNNIPDKFILFLGKLEPRKNICSLIRAFNVLKEKDFFKDLFLIIAGSRGWLYDDILDGIVKSKHKKSIILKNFVFDEERPFLYSLASVFVYPSFFEGFGFPPLEAMACNTPTIVANTSSLPEVVGGGSLLIDPCNINDITDAISKILTNENLRSRLVKEGIERTKLFDWQRAAEFTLETIIV